MLYKRGSKWWVRFTARGREIRVTSGTDRRELAEEFEQRLREAIWREKALGQEVHTWEEACERWLKEKAHKRSIKRDAQAIAALGLSGILDAIGPPVVGRPRELATLRSILNAAVRWGWLSKAPRVQINAPPKQDPRWITGEEFDRLILELPVHARAMAQFAASTGLRKSNILRLRWSAVDLANKQVWVASGETKGGRGIGVPLFGDSLAVLKGQQGKHPNYVFTDHKGRAPVRDIKTAWGKAIKRAGLPGFRFHDLRHTWASWHTLHGTSPIELKELGGWSSLAMVERYSHLNPAHLAHRAGNARPYRSGGRKRGNRHTRMGRKAT